MVHTLRLIVEDVDWPVLKEYKDALGSTWQSLLVRRAIEEAKAWKQKQLTKRITETTGDLPTA